MSQDLNLEEGTSSQISEELKGGTNSGFDILGIRSRAESPTSSYGLAYKKKILDPHRPRINWSFFILSVIAISIDPLFFYIPVVNDNKKCLGLDKKLGIMAIVLRSVLDLFHLLYIILQLCPDYSAPHLKYDLINSSHENARDTPMKYLMSFFLIDILAILPLPQVVIGMAMRGSKFLNAVNLLKYFVIFQSVPRAIRIYPLYTEVRGNSGIVAEATWPKAVFNLLLYMLAGHVLGALWYFFAIERLTVCWKKACVHHNACSHGSFYCDDNSGDYRFLNDFCPTKMQNTTIFNFGIFSDALQSGVVEVTDFPQKFLHCLQWGLQNLSCFGQNLQTSSHVWENFFAILITISGLVLFLFLIGNIQIYLQSKTIRSEEMRLKLREIEQWMPYQKLSKDLQQEVRKHQQYLWRETKGVDVENFLNNLPKNLKRSINRELFLGFLLRVPIFDSMKNEQVLSAMCDRLKPVLYTAESYIVQEGDPVDEMLFIVRGKLLCATTDGKGKDLCNAAYLVGGDFIGEEVFTWALNPGSAPDLPVSTRTVRALTEIEGFVLTVDDLKFAASQFRQQNEKKLRHIFRFYSLPWRTWAACSIQVAWRRYVRTKLKESLHEEIDRLQASSAKFG